MTRMLMVLAVCVIAAAASPALAVGPVDVEVGVKYWVHEVEPDGEGETYDGDAPGFFAEVWINKLGFTAAWHQSRVDENGVESDVDFQGIDARWKLFSVTDNNFIGLGAGLQQLEFDSPDGSADSTGFRLVADGQAGLGKIVYVFGEAVYYIGMDDADLPGGGSLEDIEGWEFEFGVSVKPFPFLNAKAGYRTSQVDGTFEGNSSDTKFDGWFGAVSVNF